MNSEPSELKDAAKLALELGHTDQELIFRNYRELVKPEQAEKYWNIRPAKSFDTDPDRLIKVQEAAVLSSVDPTFIRKAIAHRELRVVILGPKAHRIRLGELHRWCRSRQTKAMI